MHLAEEWQRGAHRDYQDVEAELPILKGKWRMGEQLRRLGAALYPEGRAPGSSRLFEPLMSFANERSA